MLLVLGVFMRILAIVLALSVMLISSCASEYSCFSKRNKDKCIETLRENYPTIPQWESTEAEALLVQGCRLGAISECRNLIRLNYIRFPNVNDLDEYFKGRSGDKEKEYYSNLIRNGYKTHKYKWVTTGAAFKNFQIRFEDYLEAYKKSSEKDPELVYVPLLYLSLIGITPDDSYAEKACRANMNDETSSSEFLSPNEVKSVCHIIQKAYREGKYLTKDYNKAFEMNRIPFENSINQGKVDVISKCDFISMYYDKNTNQNLKQKIKNILTAANINIPTRGCYRYDDFVAAKHLRLETEEERRRSAVSAYMTQRSIEEYDRKKAEFDSLPDNIEVDGKKCRKSSIDIKLICE